MSRKGRDTNDGEQGHDSKVENSSHNNKQLRDKTGNNKRWSDNNGTPPPSHPLQLDEVSLIITGVSAKLMSNLPVCGVMHSEPVSQERQQQRQLVDTLTGELLVKLLIYNCYWHTRPAPAPPSGRVNLDRATPCIHMCMHTSNLLLHMALKSRSNYRLYCSWHTGPYSGGH